VYIGNIRGRLGDVYRDRIKRRLVDAYIGSIQGKMGDSIRSRLIGVCIGITEAT
jgi:hypothetical protein